MKGLKVIPVLTLLVVFVSVFFQADTVICGIGSMPR
jgi:hypothetical protein